MAIGRSFLRAGRAEHKPLKRLLNKQSGEETVCGFSVQMPLSCSPEQRASGAVSLSDLSVQGEIRLSLGPTVNPLSHRCRMSIHPACRQKVCWVEMVG